MQISPDLVEWDVVLKKAEKGTLEEDLYEIGENESWADNRCTWKTDSFKHYCRVGMALDTLVPRLENDLKLLCQQSVSLLLNGTCDLPKELGGALDPEYFVGSISPEKIKYIKVNLDKIDSNKLLLSFNENVDADLKNDIGDPHLSFIGYIEQWASLLGEAESKKMGILVHVG